MYPSMIHNDAHPCASIGDRLSSVRIRASSQRVVVMPKPPEFGEPRNDFLAFQACRAGSTRIDIRWPPLGARPPQPHHPPGSGERQKNRGLDAKRPAKESPGQDEARAPKAWNPDPLTASSKSVHPPTQTINNNESWAKIQQSSETTPLCDRRDNDRHDRKGSGTPDNLHLRLS